MSRQKGTKLSSVTPEETAMKPKRIIVLFGLLPCLCFLAVPRARAQNKETLIEQLRQLDTRLLTDRPREQLTEMLARHAQQGLETANLKSSLEWRKIQSRDQWEAYRHQCLEALRASLGRLPAVPKDLHLRVTRTLPGDGFQVDNLLFESRPGLWVTANLYRPDPPRSSMPGILLCHSHHNPKTQGELQDMGMTWARLGCLVLVMDQLGHGERRQHPFVSAQDYSGQFPVGRQDYHFRYNTGIQLHLIGDSLVGWMVWDLWRGVDLLLSRPGIDPKRIILMGSVAGGGDPAAVAAALDERIAAAVPFNFGGPQPETPFPLSADAEDTFNYAGSGDWESTRNLRLSCRDGFLPWIIVGGIAPRHLIYPHEFSWDQEHDPVWKRLQRIYGDFYRAPECLDFTHGFGVLQGRPPQASHCNNIGAPHRQRIHAALKRWFNIPGSPADEYQKRLPTEDLSCMTERTVRELKPLKLHELTSRLAEERVLHARSVLKQLAPAARTIQLQDKWQSLLGAVRPGQVQVLRVEKSLKGSDGVEVERIVLETEPGILVPLVILRPGGRAPAPIVLGVAQSGKAAFLRERARLVAELLAGGAAICLPDLRGTGETSTGISRGRESADTSVSSTELMLGETLVGARLRDVRSVLRFLGNHPDLDARRIAIWGDSFAPANPPDRDLKIPLGVPEEPGLSEPLGGLLALLTALYEKDVQVVYARGALTGFESVLQGQFCYIPHDVIIPGVLTVGDLCDVAAALAPRPVRLEGLVDGLNRRADLKTVASEYEPAHQAYTLAAASGHLVMGDPTDDSVVAHWILASLLRR
jgi:dienelactone hydrolase